MFNVMAAGVLALAMLTPSAPIEASAAMSPPPGRVAIDVQTVNGSGCPAGSAAVNASADNTSFTVSYSDFLAQAGGGATAVDARKNCQINMLVHVPQGFTFAVAKAEYQGYAHLERGATGLQSARYHFTGASATAEASQQFSGPFDGTWYNADRTAEAALVYAPCGADTLFNINTELRVDGTAADKVSFMTMDSTRASVRTVFQLSWKQCA